MINPYKSLRCLQEQQRKQKRKAYSPAVTRLTNTFSLRISVHGVVAVQQRLWNWTMSDVNSTKLSKLVTSRHACCSCSGITVEPDASLQLQQAATGFQQACSKKFYHVPPCSKKFESKMIMACSGEMKTFTRVSPSCRVVRDPSASMQSLQHEEF